MVVPPSPDLDKLQKIIWKDAETVNKIATTDLQNLN